MTSDTPRAPTAPVGKRTRGRWLRNPYLWALLLGMVTLTLMRPLLRREPAPPPVLGQLPAYSLVDSSGRAWGSAELAGRVYVANFFFTRCASICPLLTRAMARLQDAYDARGVDGVHLVSITVDPEYDTPEVLARYERQYGVRRERWRMLTGSREAIERLAHDGFRLAIGEAREPQPGLIDVAHSGKLVLVDGLGRIRGYYDTDEPGLDETLHRSLHVLRESHRRPQTPNARSAAARASVASLVPPVSDRLE